MKYLTPSVLSLMAVVLLSAVFNSCAAPGPKYIDIAYTGTPETVSRDTLGISRFTDARTDKAKGELGHRTLNDNSKEIYLVRGLDLATTITDVTQSFLEQKGMKVKTAPPWTPTLEGLAEAASRTDYLLTADINAFECAARKKGAITEMHLEIDIRFYLASPPNKTLTTIPVNLTLTRTDINFSRDKLESFFNDTLAEALAKALAFTQN